MNLIKTSLLIVAILFIGCKKDDPIENNDSFGLFKDQLIEIDGLERQYHLYVPENHIDKPLVLALHGSRGSHDDMLGDNFGKSPHKLWLDYAEKEEFILVYPNGTLGEDGNRGWNDCRNDNDDLPDTDDVKFISELIKFLEDKYNYDSKRIYAVGTSNGGHLAFRLAQEIPNEITAFASIIASMPKNSKCVDSDVPISALFMNGTDDPFLPFDGGQMISNRGEVLSSDQCINYWLKRNKTDTIPEIEGIVDTDFEDDSTVHKFSYQGGVNDTEVIFYRIKNGGHTEPSISERYSNLVTLGLGNQNGDIEMVEEVWNFFKNQTK